MREYKLSFLRPDHASVALPDPARNTTPDDSYLISGYTVMIYIFRSFGYRMVALNR